MTTAEPVRPAARPARGLEASVLAAFQLVEDARLLGSDRSRRRERARLVAERTIASRRMARELGARDLAG
jgi:hypothetical protein